MCTLATIANPAPSARALAARDREITNAVFSRVLRRAGDAADVIALGEKTRATVARYLAGIDRPGQVRRLVDAGEIAADTAADLLADWVLS